MYQLRRDRLLDGLARTGLRPYVPEGTYFVIADTSAFPTFVDDVDFCRRLISEVGVAAIPPSAFYCEEHRHLARRHARSASAKGKPRSRPRPRDWRGWAVTALRRPASRSDRLDDAGRRH